MLLLRNEQPHVSVKLWDKGLSGDDELIGRYGLLPFVLHDFFIHSLMDRSTYHVHEYCMISLFTQWWIGLCTMYMNTA